MPIQRDFILHWLEEMAEAAAALRERQPWKAAYERDYGWLSAVVTEHYEGNETNVKVLAAWRLGGLRRHQRRGVRAASRQIPARRAASDARPWVSRLRLAPMVELLAYVADNGFSNYIASRGGRDFMRPVSQEVYGIPCQLVIGSSSALA